MSNRASSNWGHVLHHQCDLTHALFPNVWVSGIWICSALGLFEHASTRPPLHAQLMKLHVLTMLSMRSTMILCVAHESKGFGYMWLDFKFSQASAFEKWGSGNKGSWVKRVEILFPYAEKIFVISEEVCKPPLAIHHSIALEKLPHTCSNHNSSIAKKWGVGWALNVKISTFWTFPCLKISDGF